MRAKLYEGPGQEVFKMSARSTVATSTTRGEGYRMLKEAVKGCVGSMPHGLGQHIESAHVYAVMQSAVVTDLMAELETESTGAVDEATLKAAQQQLDGLVLSEIDKARGELCIM